MHFLLSCPYLHIDWNKQILECLYGCVNVMFECREGSVDKAQLSTSTVLTNLWMCNFCWVKMCLYFGDITMSFTHYTICPHRN